jgi:hypothetical protein
VRPVGPEAAVARAEAVKDRLAYVSRLRHRPRAADPYAAAERAKLRVLARQAAKGFDPDQPRDPDGRFASEGEEKPEGERPAHGSSTPAQREAVFTRVAASDSFLNQHMNSSLRSALAYQQAGWKSPGQATAGLLLARADTAGVRPEFAQKVAAEAARAKSYEGIKTIGRSQAEKDYAMLARQAYSNYSRQAEDGPKALAAQEYLRQVAVAVAHGEDPPARPAELGAYGVWDHRPQPADPSRSMGSLGDNVDPRSGMFGTEHLEEIKTDLEHSVNAQTGQDDHGLTGQDYLDHDRTMAAGRALAERIDGRDDVVAARAALDQARGSRDAAVARLREDPSDERAEAAVEATRLAYSNALTGYSQTLRDATVAEVAAVRPLGQAEGARVNITGDPVGARLVEGATALYPTAWLAQGNGSHIDVAEAERGYFRKGQSDQDRHIVLDNSSSPIGTRGEATAVHELGHYMEATVPGLQALETVEMLDRTQGEAPLKISVLTGNSAYGDQEIAFKNEFVTPYAGKVYGSPHADLPYEQFTVGIQSIMNGDFGSLVGAQGYRADPGLRSMVLGALVTLP